MIGGNLSHGTQLGILVIVYCCTVNPQRVTLLATHEDTPHPQPLPSPLKAQPSGFTRRILYNIQGVSLGGYPVYYNIIYLLYLNSWDKYSLMTGCSATPKNTR